MTKTASRTLRNLTAALALLALAATAAAQEEPAAEQCEAPETPTVSYVNDVQMIFDFNCVSCHQQGAANGDLTLEYGLSYADLVGAPAEHGELARVQPGSPEESYLFHKLMGTHLEVGGAGDRMPLGLGGLPERDLNTISAWINECALDN